MSLKVMPSSPEAEQLDRILRERRPVQNERQLLGPDSERAEPDSADEFLAARERWTSPYRPLPEQK